MSLKVKTTKKSWSVYIVKCRDGTLYTGSTNDLIKRISDHNAAKGAKYTRSRLPIKLVHAECKLSQSQALKREYAIKSLTRSEKIFMIGRRFRVRLNVS